MLFFRLFENKIEKNVKNNGSYFILFILTKNLEQDTSTNFFLVFDFFHFLSAFIRIYL